MAVVYAPNIIITHVVNILIRLIFFKNATSSNFKNLDCCKDVVDEIGVMGDCSKWGTPTGHDEFCGNKI